MKKMIPLLLFGFIFCHAGYTQVDEGVDAGGINSKNVQFKPLQTGRPDSQVLPGKVYGLNIVAHDTAKKGTRVFLRCGGVRPKQPLYMIDNVPYTDVDWHSFDVESIISIEIINGEKAASIYGMSGSAGAVIIYTKQKTFRVQIKDSLHHEPLPYASVQLLFNDNRRKQAFAADSAGYCLISKQLLASASSLTVSYTGYTAKSIRTGNLSFTKDPVIGLVPRNDLPEVVILPYTYRREKHFAICTTIITAEQLAKKEKKAIAPVKNIPEAGVFPNPVNRGNTVQVELVPAGEGTLNIVLSSVAGQVVNRVPVTVGKGQNRFSITIPQNIPAGAYLLTVNNTAGELVARQRIIVE